LDVGTFTNEQLVLGAGVSCESVVGLNDCSRWIACIQVSIGVARRGRQDTGKLLDKTTRLAEYTHNMATREVSGVSQGFKVSQELRRTK
jgi:hypothetical protein